jgi:hypothetical protein
MSINLMKEYSTLLDKRFTQKSLTEAHCGHDYSWDGVNSIVVFNVDNMAVQDYNLTGENRFSGGSTPANIGDEANTYTLQKRRSFSGVIEGVQNMDQKNIKKANALLKQTWDEVMVPEIDQYRLQTWANGAGLGVLNATALTNKTIVRAMLTSQAALNNKYVPRDGRVYFIGETLAVETKLAEELGYNEAFTSKAIVNGQCARLGGLPIVSVPDSWMPAGVEFMIKYKRATADPTKLKMLRALNQVRGIYGTVLEGLTRYDSFVLANKANGILVYGNDAAKIVTVGTVSVSNSKLALANATAGATFYFTEDGTNPKVSETRQVLTSGTTAAPASGTLVKVYGEKTGMTNSGIVEFIVP